MPNYDPQGIPREFGTLRDYDAQERRLHLLKRNLFAAADELRRLDEEIEPKRIVDAGQQTNYQTHMTTLRGKIKDAIATVNLIDALS